MTKFSADKGVIAFLILSGALLTAACGGGSAPPTQQAAAPPPPPPTSSGPTFTPGVFEASSNFEDRCRAPRSGFDIEGNAFPDRLGSLLEENFWLRSWTNETYLFNTEVTDRNPAGFNNPLDYFAVLRTTATTLSGRDKDEFHFTVPTDEFLQQRNSTPSATYGARFIALSDTPPRDFRVLFTEPGSPAAQTIMGEANLRRGTKILEVDGIDLVDSIDQPDIDILNNGLFPATAGEQHTFRVQDPGGLPRTIILTSANLAPNPVNLTRILNTPTGDVGYVLLNTFSPFSTEQAIADAFTTLDAAGVNDLILDLRYNGGGFLAIASQLSFMVAGSARTDGKVYERLQFNAAAGNLNPVTGQANNPTPFISTGIGFSLTEGTPLTSLNLPRVFILSTERTCSASESVINALRGVGVEVILIGDTTCGKPFGFFPEDNCGVTYFTIQFRGVNDMGFGDYADGFIPANSSALFGVRTPGCVVADDLDHDLGDTAEALLAAALQFRATGICPAITTKPQLKTGVSSVMVANDKASPAPTLFESVPYNNRDMRMPGE